MEIILIIIVGIAIFFTILYYVIRAAVLSAVMEAQHLRDEPGSKERIERAKRAVEEIVTENEDYFTDVLGSTIKKAISEALQENKGENQ